MISDKSKNLMPIQKCISGASVKDLTDTELLSIIIGGGVNSINVFDLSSQLLSIHGGLPGIYNSGVKEISEKKGIGLTKAIKIHAAFEIGRRVIFNPNKQEKIDSPEAVWKFLIPELSCMEKEKFIVLIINNKNRVLKKSIISIGTVSETIVHPREVFRDAIRVGASSIIIAHNHPSGDTLPSEEDIAATKRISQAGEIIGIHLIDHVIVTDSGFYSFRENGHSYLSSGRSK